MDAPDNMKVDHKNGDKLDNRKSNLRLCDDMLNQANRNKQKGKVSSRYKGVSYQSRTGKWKAQIGVNKRRLFLGYFDSAKEAAMAYDRAAVAHVNEFAKTNFKQVGLL